MKPLEYCKNLEEIEIIFTNIKRIELSPLENLPIKRINISGNLLENINLEPLSKMRELERMELSENNLREIDLRPLEELKKIEMIDLHGNLLKEIDFKPLRYKNIIRIHADSFNTFKQIELKPLFENYTEERCFGENGKQNCLTILSFSCDDFDVKSIEKQLTNEINIVYKKEHHYFETTAGELKTRNVKRKLPVELETKKEINKNASLGWIEITNIINHVKKTFD